MSLERKGAQHQMAVVDKFHDPAADYSMTTRDYVLRPTIAAAAIVITLPSVSEAKGRFYSIIAKSATKALTVTIQDQDESEGWIDIVLERDGSKVFLYSDGRSWANLTGGTVGVTKTTIPSADVLLLATTPITLVSAPGAGRIIEFLSATFKLEYGGSNGFTETDDNLAIKYTDASGVAVSDTVEMTGFIDQTAHTVTRTVPVNDAIVAYTAAQNQALVLDNINDNFAGNAGDDNILYVYTSFRIINV